MRAENYGYIHSRRQATRLPGKFRARKTALWGVGTVIRLSEAGTARSTQSFRTDSRRLI